MLKLSIAGYTFHGLVNRGQANIFGLLESVKYRYHLRGFDLWNGLLGHDPEKYLQPEFLHSFHQAVQERDLEICNYHADGCHIWEDDAEARQKHQRLAERHIEAGELIRASTIRIDAGGRERHWTAEQFDFIVSRYRQWAKRAGERGYRIGPQVHWGAETWADNLLKLAKAVNHPAFGIVLSIGGVQGIAPDEGDRTFAPYTMHTHLDPNNLQTRIDPALKILTDAGYDGYISVEDVKEGNEYQRAAKLVAEAQWAIERLDGNRKSTGK